MRVRVQEQDEEAKVTVDNDGEHTLTLKPGAFTARQFVALVLALEPLQQGGQYLQRTG